MIFGVQSDGPLNPQQWPINKELWGWFVETRSVHKPFSHNSSFKAIYKSHSLSTQAVCGFDFCQVNRLCPLLQLCRDKECVRWLAHLVNCRCIITSSSFTTIWERSPIKMDHTHRWPLKLEDREELAWLVLFPTSLALLSHIMQPMT